MRESTETELSDVESSEAEPSKAEPSKAEPSEHNPLLRLRSLKTQFFTDEGTVRAVDGVSLTVRPGETVCVVGESGCGKSVMARSILRLISKPGRIVEGEIMFRRSDGSTVDLTDLPSGRAGIRAIRGQEIAMVFQEPMTSLSPVHTVGSQIVETLRVHKPVSSEEATTRAIDMLGRVGIPRPADRFHSYPFELSGGMRQRAVIAMALMCRPRLLIADEPTTALDVTTQADLLALLRELQQDLGMALLFITHDLGVVAQIADRVAVMYLGRVVEEGSAHQTFNEPKHPYTRALLRAMPPLHATAQQRLSTLEGRVPHPLRRPAGCAFHPRCPSFMAGVCDTVEPPPEFLETGQTVRCLLYSDHKDADYPASSSASAHGPDPPNSP
jgi:peptide/nickel transport system ATP-binding protein